MNTEKSVIDRKSELAGGFAGVVNDRRPLVRGI
jgi:hypothetical protein